MQLRSLLSSRRGRVIVAVAMVLFSVMAYRQFTQMDRRFFQLSGAGLKGLVFYLVGDYRRAAANYRQHYAEVFDVRQSARDASQIALLQGKLQAAKISAQSALQRSPGDIDSLLTLGEVAIAERRLDDALRLLGKILDLERDQFDALMLASIVYAQLERYGEAIDALNRALRNGTTETRDTTFLSALGFTGELAARADQPLCLLGSYYRYLRIFDPSNGRAAVAYSKAAIAAKDFPDKAYLNWGIVEYRSGRTEQALERFLQAIRLNPQFALAYRWAAWVYSERGELANEYQMLKAAYENAKDDPFHIEDLGHFLRVKLGDLQQALALSLKVLETNPNNAQELGSAGFVYAAMGQHEKAIRYYEKAIHLEPRNPSLYEDLGVALADMEKPQAALETFEKALIIEPQRPSAHSQTAYLYARLERFDKAIHHYQEAFRYGESDLNALESLCGLYHQRGDYRKAVNCLERLLALSPDNASAQHLYSYALRNLQGKK